MPSMALVYGAQVGAKNQIIERSNPGYNQKIHTQYSQKDNVQLKERFVIIGRKKNPPNKFTILN